MRIRTRATLLGMLPALLVATLLGAYLILARIGDLEEGLHTRGTALARHVAQGALYSVVSGNREPLRTLLQQTLREPDVVYVGIHAPDGSLYAQAGRLPKGLHVPLQGGEVEGRGHVAFVAPVELAALELDDPYTEGQGAVASPPVAWVKVVLSRAGKEAAARQMLLASLGIVALGLAFAWLLVGRMVPRGLGPLMQIIGTVRRIAAGDLDARVPVTARSELRILQEDINQMGAALSELQRDMQRRVDAATAQLAEQKAAAERANAAKSRFLAAASHDLRQPMHALGLYVEALRPQLEGREAAATLARIAATVSAMEELFNAILDVSKLDAGVIVPRSEPVSIAGLFDRLAGDFQAEAASRRLRLRVRPLPVWVQSDPVLLDRILRNLLANALRYTRQGGVLLAARRHGQGLRLQVWDTGIGIPAESLERIFQEFYQVDNPQRDRSRGLGLGLAIVDRLARLLGYPLTVRSRPGRGTVFSLDIPGLVPEPAAQGSRPAGLAERLRLAGRVAVVDDDALVLDALPTLLASWGLEVVAAVDAESLLARLPHPPDLLITDYRLADGLDGLRVVERLRQVYGQALPVVIITGDTSPGGIQEITAHGHPLLHKPVQPARLRAVLQRLLAGGRRS